MVISMQQSEIFLVKSSVTFKGQILLTHTAGDIIKISGDDVSELGFQAQASSSALTPGSIFNIKFFK